MVEDYYRCKGGNWWRAGRRGARGDQEKGKYNHINVLYVNYF